MEPVAGGQLSNYRAKRQCPVHSALCGHRPALHSLFPGPLTSHVMTSSASRSYLRIHAVNIFVRDQDRSLRFFVDQLGFEVAFDSRLSSGGRWVAVSPPDGSALLALVSPKPGSREYKLIGRATQVVFVTENVIATFEAWRKRGVRFQNTPRLRRIKYERPAEAGHGQAP